MTIHSPKNATSGSVRPSEALRRRVTVGLGGLLTFMAAGCSLVHGRQALDSNGVAARPAPGGAAVARDRAPGVHLQIGPTATDGLDDPVK